MDKILSHDKKGRSLANDGLLPALVQTLTERGIIQPEEADDMLSLLSACSKASARPMGPARRDAAARPGPPAKRPPLLPGRSSH